MSQSETSRRVPVWGIVVLTALALAILGGAAGVAFVMSGVYDIGADVPHAERHHGFHAANAMRGPPKWCMR